MSARGNFRGGYNAHVQSGYPMRGQYSQGPHSNDPRTYSQSSGHGTPNSSFHGSPPPQSPFGGSRGSWGGQQQYSPQGSVSHCLLLEVVANIFVVSTPRSTSKVVIHLPVALKAIIKVILQIRRRHMALPLGLVSLIIQGLIAAAIGTLQEIIEAMALGQGVGDIGADSKAGNGDLAAKAEMAVARTASLMRSSKTTPAPNQHRWNLTKLL